MASKAQLQRLRGAARATAIKDKRVNIRLSSIDLMDIQAREAIAQRRRADRPAQPYRPLMAA